MKKLILSLILPFLLASCSEDNILEENTTPNISVSSIIRKNYNPTTNVVLSTHTTNVVNNKIQSILKTNSANSQTSISTYYYTNNKISLIETITNNILTNKTYFFYDSNNKLIEHRSDSYNNQGQIHASSKVNFNRIQGVIYADWTRNSINAPTYTPVTSSEIILDQNLNEIYCKKYDHLNNETKKMETLYDANNNIILQESFILNEDGTYTSLFSKNYTYGTAINTLSFVNLQSIGKENMMLLYHLGNDVGPINEFNVKDYSPNILNTFNSTLFIGNIFYVTNQSNSNNYCSNSEYSTFEGGNLSSKFTYEFIFN